MFQKTVLKSINQDESLIALRWASFQKFLAKVEYIKTVKEEKYQDGFLVDIFENCLGYTLDMTNPKSFNLEREKKNETDGKKADGVIYVDEKVVGVIELKGQDTKNLDKIETQAFNYHASHSNSKYIIISNFDELRFYVDKKTAYEKFNLFTLNYEEFKKLHLLISYESIKDDIPLKLKEKSNSFEQNISKQLYKDFSNFRTLLFENIVKNNPTIDKQTLLRLTQKLCDRVVFMLFAEDRRLININTINEIIEKHNQDIHGFSLYHYFKIYFDAINKGNDKLNIPHYNGGLFAEDKTLDDLIIDDAVLKSHLPILSNYDFASEISVNILGHIFEQSLTDLEELQANIDNVNFDKTKSKRKKDGVFYTPEYITRYIVENTLGKMCSEKRKELLIGNGILIPSNPKKLTKQEQQTKDNLQEYKNWLLNLKILDPACGSGAFLNQALEYLINEHKNLQNDLALMGDLFASYMVEEEILEHNLYGVDINEDAVEIAKLSLWLRTAKRGRALTKLADKIVCANSLLNMPFSENSFDVVIGNPPYVNARNMDKEQRLQISIKYPLLSGAYDLYLPFLLQGFDLIKDNGLYGWIIPNKLLISEYSKVSLDYLKSNSLHTIINISKLPIFQNVGVYPIITIGEKVINNNETRQYEISNIEDLENLQQFRKTENIFKRYRTIKDFDILLNSGTTGFEAQKIIPLINEDKKGVKFIVSGTVDPYIILEQNVPYMKNVYKNPYIKFDEDIIAKSKFDFWNKPKIIIAGMTKRIEAVYIENPTALGVGIYGIYDFKNFNPKFLLSLLNSKFLTYYLNIEFKDKHLAGGYLAINKSTIEELPIVYTYEQEPFIQKADLMLELNKKLQELKQNFINELNLEKVPTKLQKFEELDFDDFVKEYAKAKKLKFADKLEERNFKNEWQRLFENDKKEVLEIQNQINITDKEIDQMVYKLYDLTPDEIKIVEGI
ncbi:Eco57I restriction-modification methylase domain-containing protein [Aliarcobacter skirrowii]|nr:N-6 DNA methylase [Aliarcobacter skirrowii]AXX84239.1 type IIG restriction/modification system [Aliarcobacter skirrowii CCUG 10374]KAB0621580.1 N-6 DNA methylase [Aliarcobacter skirrowii CCUG 10374]